MDRIPSRYFTTLPFLKGISVKNVIILLSIPKLFLVETCFHVRNGQLVSSAEWLTGFFMVFVIVKKVFLKSFSEPSINSLCLKVCNSSNTLQFFHIPPNNVSGILWKKFSSSYFAFYYHFIYFLCDPTPNLFDKIQINSA